LVVKAWSKSQVVAVDADLLGLLVLEALFTVEDLFRKFGEVMA